MPDQPQTPQKATAGHGAHVPGRDLTVPYRAAGGGERATGDGPALVGNVPQQPPGFQPRAGLMAALDAAGPVSVVRAATEMRGVGKSHLAAAYARARLAAGWRLVAWVNAVDPVGLAGGLAAVAEAAGLAAHGGDPGLAVRHWLEAGGERCLVVFDGATSADVLRPYLPAGGAARVVITSERRSVAELGAPVRVGMFTPGEARAFLTERTGLTDPDGADELAAELGFLPLGLAQAAAVIQGQQLEYGTYLERLRALPVAGYLAWQEEQPYPRGVAEAVLLSLEAVRAGDLSGVRGGVLGLLSVLSAAGVRRDLLHAAGRAGALGGGELGEAAVEEALGRLAEGSLVAFALDGEVVTAHRLVLRVVRERLAGQGRLAGVCRAAAEVVGARAGVLAGSRDRAVARDVPEQVAALWQAAAGLPGDAGELEAALLDLRQAALCHLNRLGDSAAQAVAVGEPLVRDSARLLGPDHPGTLASQANLAIAYQEAGRATEAITLHERTLADMERLLGPDHPDTLAARNNLANAHQEKGHGNEAIDLHERTLADRERLLGPDHPDTLASRNNLANAYQERGWGTKAIALHERTLADRERLLGPDHPDTLASQGNLAIAYQEAGQATEAITLHERTLADMERLLGPDHPDTLAWRNSLAIAYQEVGRTANAPPRRHWWGLRRKSSPRYPDS